jgi:uncharacterized membrane protein YjgN (DUF898 family)
MAGSSARFHFDGGPASFLCAAFIATLVTVCTFGIGSPYAVVLLERWRAEHTYIDGQRLRFTGTALGLTGLLVKCCVLCFLTFGLYSFWVLPRLQRWKVENTAFDPTWRPRTLG